MIMIWVSDIGMLGGRNGMIIWRQGFKVAVFCEPVFGVLEGSFHLPLQLLLGGASRCLLT